MNQIVCKECGKGDENTPLIQRGAEGPWCVSCFEKENWQYAAQVLSLLQIGLASAKGLRGLRVMVEKYLMPAGGYCGQHERDDAFMAADGKTMLERITTVCQPNIEYFVWYKEGGSCIPCFISRYPAPAAEVLNFLEKKIKVEA